MGNKFLSDKEIIETIKEYIDDNVYSRAILIDGAWGSGKTFFIKNKLIKELETYEKFKKNNNCEEKKIIYISLYGINSTVDITNEIYLKSINIEDKNSKIYSISRLGGKFLSDLMKNKGFDITKYFDDIKSLIDISNYILIFDDLERCKCEISDVLGYINNFVEHRGMKVIIVVNEEEIGDTSVAKKIYIEKIKKKRVQKNKELLDKFAKDMSIKNEYDTNNDKDIIINDKTSKIEEYQKIKEKLIGTTIKYRPNLEESIQIIIENNINNNELRCLLINDISIFVRKLEENNHINLRTFQFFISKIKQIYLWLEDISCCKKELVLTEVIKYTFIICIYYKKGIYMNEWNVNTLYGDIALEPYDSERGKLYGEKVVKGFKFIDDFIVYSKISDKVIIDRTIQLFVDELMEVGDEDDPLNKLEYWYMLEDKDVDGYIDEVYSYIKDKKYLPKRFQQVLKQLSVMESLGFEKYNIDKDILPMMVNQIEEYDLYINYNEKEVFIDDIKALEKYEGYIEKLNEAVGKSRSNIDIANINRYLLNIDKWGSNLFSYYSETKNNMKIVSGLLCNVDLDKLKYNIENSDTKQLYYFRRFIVSVYKNYISQLNMDKDVIEELIVFVEGIEPRITLKTKKKNLQWLKENLRDIVNMM